MNIRINRLTTSKTANTALFTCVFIYLFIFCLISFTFLLIIAFNGYIFVYHNSHNSGQNISHDTTKRVFGSFRPGQTQAVLRSHRS